MREEAYLDKMHAIQEDVRVKREMVQMEDYHRACANRELKELEYE